MSKWVLRNWLKRLISICLGFAIALASLVGGLWISATLAALLTGPDGPSRPLHKYELGPLLYVRALSQPRFLAFLWISLITFFAFVILSWSPPIATPRSTIVVLLSLAAALPLSAINWMAYDAFIPMAVQFVIDLAIVICGLVAYVELRSIKPVLLVRRVFLEVLSLVLLFTAVVLPGLYAGIWLSAALGLTLELHNWISPAAASVTAAIAVLKYRDERRRPPIAPPPNPSLQRTPPG